MSGVGGQTYHKYKLPYKFVKHSCTSHQYFGVGSPPLFFQQIFLLELWLFCPCMPHPDLRGRGEPYVSKMIKGVRQVLGTSQGVLSDARHYTTPTETDAFIVLFNSYSFPY